MRRPEGWSLPAGRILRQVGEGHPAGHRPEDDARAALPVELLDDPGLPFERAGEDMHRHPLHDARACTRAARPERPRRGRGPGRRRRCGRRGRSHQHGHENEQYRKQCTSRRPTDPFRVDWPRMPWSSSPTFLVPGLAPRLTGLRYVAERGARTYGDEEMTMSDQQITCSECGGSFIFSDSERQFYETKGLSGPPKRCKTCRQARKAADGARGGAPRTGGWDSGAGQRSPGGRDAGGRPAYAKPGYDRGGQGRTNGAPGGAGRPLRDGRAPQGAPAGAGGWGRMGGSDARPARTFDWARPGPGRGDAGPRRDTPGFARSPSNGGPSGRMSDGQDFRARRPNAPGAERPFAD